MTLLLIAILFLPLFPFSALLNWTLGRVSHAMARCVLLLFWPQVGVAALSLTSQKIPDGMVVWALLSAMFYALRLLTVRDLGIWAGFIASSGLALVWGMAGHAGRLEMQLFAFAFSLPAALLALLAWPLTRRFGAAFAGLNGGLAGSLPRFSGMLTVTVLAATATPPSPGFFALLGLLDKLDWTAVPPVLVIWLLWSWAATKLLQGFLSGGERADAVADIDGTTTVVYTSLVAAFVVAGLILTGGV